MNIKQIKKRKFENQVNESATMICKLSEDAVVSHIGKKSDIACTKCTWLNICKTTEYQNRPYEGLRKGSSLGITDGSLVST